MDLSRPESSDLSLGLHPHVNGHARGHARAAPLLLFDDSEDVKTEGSVGGGGYDDEGDDEGVDQHFSLLGHALCVKRPRRALYGGGGSGGGEVSSCSSSSAAMRPVKRQATGADLEARRGAVRAWGNQPLAEADPDVHALMEREKERQVRGIELIASENFVCRAVLEALGRHLTNKYSEGHPGAHYYGGNQHIDAIERLCHPHRLWPRSRLLGGSTFSHTHDKLEERAMDFHPKILICGGSSYPREWDFARMRLIADRCGAVLMCDMAHISGLVAAKEMPRCYVVYVGRVPGVYEEWKDCQKQVNNFSGNSYQGYESREVAEEKWRRHGRKKWRNFLVITTLLLFIVGYVFYFI